MKSITLIAVALLSVGSSGGQEHACMKGLNEYYSGSPTTQEPPPLLLSSASSSYAYFHHSVYAWIAWMNTHSLDRSIDQSIVSFLKSRDPKP